MRIPSDRERCMYTTRDGKRCRGWRGSDPELPLCYYHERQHRVQHEPATAAHELEAVLGRPPRLKSARAINLVLNRVFLAAAQGRVTPSQAASLASLARLLLESLRDVQEEKHLLNERRQASQSGELIPGEKVVLTEAECMIVSRVRETAEMIRRKEAEPGPRLRASILEKFHWVPDYMKVPPPSPAPDQPAACSGNETDPSSHPESGQ